MVIATTRPAGGAGRPEQQARCLRELRHNEHVWKKGSIIPVSSVGDCLPRLIENGTLELVAQGELELWPRRIVPPADGVSAPGADGAGISLIIAVWNQWEHTEPCLRSVLADLPAAEIIVVDNGSTDGTPAGLKQFPQVRVIRFPVNRGVPIAYNTGMAAATGRILGILNNDTIIHTDGLKGISKAAHEEGIACFVGGKHTPETLAFAGYTEREHESTYADGCCLMFRRDVWEDVGTFDEEYTPAYCEDADWAYRAWAKGYGWSIHPRALLHKGAQTSKRLEGMNALVARNTERLRRKIVPLGAAHRIAIHRHGAVGDVVMATPTLRALRRRWPMARIWFETSRQMAALLEGLPSIDTVTADHYTTFTKRIELDGAYEERHRAGEWVHPALAMAEAAGVLEAVEADREYEIPEPAEMAEWAREQLPDGRRYLALGLRSEHRKKQNWRGSWSELAARLPDWTLVPLDAHSRPALGDGMALYGAPNVRDMTGRTLSLRHLFALLLRCHACVSMDTGIQHLAAAAGLPLVGLYTDPEFSRVPPTKNICFIGNLECVPCMPWHRCEYPGGKHCLDYVTPDKIAKAVRKVTK